jgi:hypothetical protein
VNTSFSQVAQGLTVFVALSAVVTACSAASPDEGVGTTAQATSCLPGGSNPAGIRLESCIIPKPQPTPPPQPPAAVCESHPGCVSIPMTSLPVPEVAEPDPKTPLQTTCDTAPDFTAYLTSIGCKPQVEYQQAGENPLYPWSVPIAFCPTTPTINDGVTWETMACDECTGTPPNADWVVVAYNSPSTHVCTGGGVPAAGCGLGGCLPKY